MYSPPPSERSILRHLPVSSSALATNVFKCMATLDFSCRLVTKTLHDASSIQVMKYLKPVCEHMGSFPQTLEKTQPRISAVQESVDFWILACVCLPLRQASQWCGVSEELPTISIPLTIPLHTMFRTAST